MVVGDVWGDDERYMEEVVVGGEEGCWTPKIQE